MLLLLIANNQNTMSYISQKKTSFTNPGSLIYDHLVNFCELFLSFC